MSPVIQSGNFSRDPASRDGFLQYRLGQVSKGRKKCVGQIQGKRMCMRTKLSVKEKLKRLAKMIFRSRSVKARI
jgi:hypothetical protein